MKKEWEKPSLLNLSSKNTNEETCYCEEGTVALYGMGGGCKPNPGHHHKPGHPCPPKPVKPSVPGGDETLPIS